ncbi:MAG: transposase [Nitrosomonas sp.]|nr:transposase [Nitrosomonas sp.]
MLILRDILSPLQQEFRYRCYGEERGVWFVYTLLAVITHFTSSRTANLLRCLQTMFGLSLTQRRFYTFMASSRLPWSRLWRILWSLIPEPATTGRLLIALDDFINPKVGKKIFGCASFFDHAAKTNQSNYHWSQNIVSIGLLKIVKGRWACLPLAFRFYHMKKTIDAGEVKVSGKAPRFQKKHTQAVEMLSEISAAFCNIPLLVVTDSWFGNDGLFKPMRKTIGRHCHLLSRLRTNTTLFALPSERQAHQRGRPQKYGDKMGNAESLAGELQKHASIYSVNLYGKQRNVAAYDQLFMSKALKCTIRVVWVYHRSRWVALFTTDLGLSVEQIIEYYGARWKIEAGFKEIKQEVGSSKSQTRCCHAVTNHLNFCMMATAITWIYADHLEKTPQRCYAVNNRRHFAFSDVRKLITRAALNKDFDSFCPKHVKTTRNSIIDTLLRLVA